MSGDAGTNRPTDVDKSELIDGLACRNGPSQLASTAENTTGPVMLQTSQEYVLIVTFSSKPRVAKRLLARKYSRP